jgi:hypothetical protein
VAPSSPRRLVEAGGSTLRQAQGERLSRTDPNLRSGPAAAVILAAALLLPAVWNGFPLIFPDSGTYLGIATGSDYAIDRSSVYGLLLKPLVQAWPGIGGLWLAVAAQALVVAAVLVAAGRTLVCPSAVHVERSSSAVGNLVETRPLLPLLAVTLLTSLPWHAGQLMPDAFTGPLVLLASLAATRAPSAPGAPLLWLGALVLALTHYTHVVLLAAVAASAVAAQLALGLDWRSAARRLGTAFAVAGTAAGLLAAANGAVLDRATMSPAGPLFLFARLHEDGLIDRWFERHCGRDAPAALCAERNLLPRDSQTLLWRDPHGPVGRHIWQAGNDAERWRWIAMMAAANRGAIAEQPGAFLGSAMRGTARQLLAFQALDDECPANCGKDRRSGVGYILARDRPGTLPALDASMQLRGTTPKALVRAVTTPIAALALLLLPAMLLIAWRRRDSTALAFTAGITAALLVNAALAGALSDVHDRYQSRIVWLAPLLILLLALRWWRPPACPPRPPGA